MVAFVCDTEESELERLEREEQIKAKVRTEEYLKTNKEKVRNELEEKMQFLKDHSGSPEELSLAKIVLGIE